MAIFHCSIKIGTRSDGRSAIACAAYRSGEIILDDETGLTHDYRNKGGVVHSEIVLPPQAPISYRQRSVLWNEVQRVEKQSNAQLFREIEVALPKELDREEHVQIVREYVEQFVQEGMCADWALHDKGDGNPHAHILLTTRAIASDGSWAVKERKAYKLDENGERIPVIDPETGEQKIGPKGRKMWQRETVQANDWNDRSKAEIWRKRWADVCNQYLYLMDKVDHRSYARQGLDLEPTQHIGVKQQAMAKDGVSLDFDKTAINAAIRQRNELAMQIRVAIRQMYDRVMAKWRELHERNGHIARDYRLAGAAGEFAEGDGGAAGRDRAAAERERTLESLMRKATRTDRQIEWIELEKEKELNARKEAIFRRRANVKAAGGIAGRERETKADQQRPGRRGSSEDIGGNRKPKGPTI